jgi:riboflavin kinase/FMN adenylyltransferase
MLIKSFQTQGIGRAKELGFPTVNLNIPDDFELEEGVHAAWFIVDGKPLRSALYYGGAPTFDDNEKKIEVYLIDLSYGDFPETLNKSLEVDVVEYIRPVEAFIDSSLLIDQINKDVSKIKKILK